MDAKLIAEEEQRSFALVFESGEEVCAPLLEFSREQGLDCARLTGIGAFSRVTFGFFDWETKDYAPITIAEQVEVLSLVGDIALAPDGDQQLHVHVVVGKRDGTAHGGHLLEASVRPTLEVMLVEAPGHLRRESDPDSGLALLSL